MRTQKMSQEVGKRELAITSIVSLKHALLLLQQADRPYLEGDEDGDGC